MPNPTRLRKPITTTILFECGGLDAAEPIEGRLGEHLSRTIRTGTYCAYVPDPRAPAGWGFCHL